MKLSEAIRLGATLGPQHFDDFFGDAGASCALGAALRAIGMEEIANDDDPRKESDAFPSLDSPAPRGWCQNCGTITDVGLLIVHMNDCRRWSREAIADWLVASGNDCESVAPTETQQENPELMAVQQ